MLISFVKVLETFTFGCQKSSYVDASDNAMRLTKWNVEIHW